MARRLASIAPLLLAACASPSDASHPPLVCDEAGVGEVAYVFHESAAFFAPYLPHGATLLVVEGGCRYHAFSWFRGRPGVLRSGVLTSDEVDEINADVLTADWSALDGEHVNLGAGADGSTLTLRREELDAQCYVDCDGHDALVTLAVRSFAWVARLWDRGTPLDGSVALDGYPSTRAPGDTRHTAWTGDADLGALFAASPYPARPRVDDAEDAALLRELRAESVTGNPPLYLEQDGALFEVGVADVLPFELALYEDRMVPWQ